MIVKQSESQKENHKNELSMPFKKKGKYYYSPSGKKLTPKQVKAYYATNGNSKKKRKS